MTSVPPFAQIFLLAAGVALLCEFLSFVFREQERTDNEPDSEWTQRLVRGAKKSPHKRYNDLQILVDCAVAAAIIIVMVSSLD